uniref:Uncharacterized protein n=1 Tax=Anguilla anguilla TaxID=7936 RepID=A0A0E9T5F7_ANGAN
MWDTSHIHSTFICPFVLDVPSVLSLTGKQHCRNRNA